MYDTLLVPTDGSEHAERAAEHALSLADAFDATVHFVTVVDVQEAAGLFDAGGVDEQFVGRLEDDARETVADLESLAGPSADVSTAVLRGRPAERILEYADEHGIDLVLMGTHGRTGLERYVTGSVTERVVRLADVPVFTVRATDTSVARGYDRILVPTDGGTPASAAADHAVALAAAFDATVHALNVVDVRSIAGSANVPTPDDVLDRLEDAGRNATDEVAARARNAGVEAVTAVTEGFPASAVLEYADDNDVDLVAMGTHGRTGLDRLLVGSNTAKVVRRAEMPVLTVHAPNDDE